MNRSIHKEVMFARLFGLITCFLVPNAVFSEEDGISREAEIKFESLGDNPLLKSVEGFFLSRPIDEGPSNGILLVVGSGEDFASDRLIMDFEARCEKVGWALGVVQFSTLDSLAHKQQAEVNDWLDRTVFRWLQGHVTEMPSGENEARTDLPLYVALNNEAVDRFLPGILNGRRRVDGWIADGGIRLPDPLGELSQEDESARGTTVPPGIVVGRRGRNRDSWELFYSLRKLNPGNRIAFLPHQGGRTGSYYYDEFGFQFLKALEGGTEEDGRWVDYESTDPLTTDVVEGGDLNVLANYLWFPNQSCLGSWKVLASARPSEPEYFAKMHSRRFAKTPPFFSKVEFHHSRIVKEPKAVLIVALDSRRPQSIFQNRDWVDFARDEGFALVVLNVKNGRRVTSANVATQWLGTRLFDYLDKGPYKEFPDLPIIWHGIGQPSYWMQRIMMLNPKRFAAWTSVAANEFAVVPQKQPMPPGLILSGRPQQNFPSLFFLQDIRKANPANRVCLLARDESLINQRYLDEFSRNFLKGSTTQKTGKGFWLRYQDGKRLTFTESKQGVDPADYVWFPNRVVSGSWNFLSKTRPQIPFPTIKKFTIKTRLEELPELNLFLRIPGNKDKKEDEDVKGVLCFCTWKGEDASLLNRLKRPDDPLVAFADRNNLAVITWNTANLLPKGTNINSLTEEEETALSRKFDSIGGTWLKGIEKVCRDNKLPKDGFLLHGMSRGSTYAHRLALRNPDKFLAVHTHIASHYEEPTKDASNIIWLVTTGEIDGGYRASREFFLAASELGYPALIKAGPSLGHAMRDDIENLSLEFFEYALDLRRFAEIKRLDPQEEGDDKITAAALFRERVSTAAYFGDFINHEVYRKGEGDFVPEGQRIMLPTEDIANAWGAKPEGGL